MQFRNYKIVYRRYAGLYFCTCVDANDNELAYLEAMHLFVEVLGAFSSFLLTCGLNLNLGLGQTPTLATYASSTSFSTFTRCAFHAHARRNSVLNRV